MILDDIVSFKKRQLKTQMEKVPLGSLRQKIMGPGLHRPLNFYGALKRKDDISIIAEVKSASPSKGIIKEEFDAVDIAKQYFENNVQAVSVLTEKQFFHGDDDYLWKIRQALPIPLLRKDFVIDLWQVYQSRCLGADAILLIASILTDDKLKKFQAVAGILGMQCLVEVHTKTELERVLDSGAKIIGINNRDLKTFDVNLNTTEKLIGLIPKEIAVVSESGIRSGEDIKYLRELGVDAVLVGESLMKAPSIGQKLKELKGLNTV